MKFFLDENLSDRVVPQILDLYPDSTHMTLRFSQDKQRFVVDELQTDLLLTRVGIKLVEEHPAADGSVVVVVSQSEHAEFISELREEFLCKSRRIANARVLVALARRLLPDFESLERLEFC
ncbi:MAG: hypothetical protein EXS36_11715 [Pedosphaera sp.]|nr:hypothetical protein [Pedosphaera sp.]